MPFAYYYFKRRYYRRYLEQQRCRGSHGGYFEWCGYGSICGYVCYLVHQLRRLCDHYRNGKSYSYGAFWNYFYLRYIHHYTW